MQSETVDRDLLTPEQKEILPPVHIGETLAWRGMHLALVQVNGRRLTFETRGLTKKAAAALARG